MGIDPVMQTCYALFHSEPEQKNGLQKSCSQPNSGSDIDSVRIRLLEFVEQMELELLRFQDWNLMELSGSGRLDRARALLLFFLAHEMVRYSDKKATAYCEPVNISVTKLIQVAWELESVLFPKSFNFGSLRQSVGRGRKTLNIGHRWTFDHPIVERLISLSVSFRSDFK